MITFQTQSSLNLYSQLANVFFNFLIQNIFFKKIGTFNISNSHYNIYTISILSAGGCWCHTKILESLLMYDLFILMNFTHINPQIEQGSILSMTVYVHIQELVQLDFAFYGSIKVFLILVKSDNKLFKFVTNQK